MLCASRPERVAGRCLHGPLEKPRCLCISSVRPPPAGSQQTVGIHGNHDDFGRALLTAEGMVPGLSVPSRRFPKVEKSVTSATVKQVPPKCKVPESSNLEVIQHLRERGLQARCLPPSASPLGTSTRASGEVSLLGEVEEIAFLSKPLFRS